MGECERGECNTPSACRAHDECLARDRKETVADVVRRMRGFGTVYDIETGRRRHWYLDAEGVKRWADNDQPVQEDRKA